MSRGVEEVQEVEEAGQGKGREFGQRERVSSLDRVTEEAIRRLELRRCRRLLLSVRLPLVYTLGILAVARLLIPFLFGPGGVVAGRAGIPSFRGGEAGTLLACSAAGAALAAFLRVQYLWSQERRLGGFQAWLLSRQHPARTMLTTLGMAALLGVLVTALPLALGLASALLAGAAWWQLLLLLLIVPACSLLGACLGAVQFFAGLGLASRRLLAAGTAAALLLWVGIWLRLGSAEGGWSLPVEEHVGRAARALTLVTPLPAVLGLSSVEWWDRTMRPSLGAWAGAAQAGLLYACLLLLFSGWAAWVSVGAYLRLAADPQRIEERPAAVPAEEGGSEFYWKGFRNPVWTREVRTRLRTRETAEFIFFASLAVAAGAFVPLVFSVRDLSDPLTTARAARLVFFWLTLTLVALVALVAPGLTADGITEERTRGTLEMLIGTPLRPREILVGKLLGAVSVLLLLISPSLPLFGLCYLFHGASGAQVLQVYLLVLVTLSVTAFIGLAQSAIWPRTGLAKFWAYAVTALFVAVPGGPFWVAAAVAAPEAGFRQELMQSSNWSVIIAILSCFGLVLFWGNASEQLEYHEY